MSPTLPRALSRATCSRNHPSSASITTLTRAFSATSLRQSTKIPPESPLYINVPTPPLSQAVEDQRPDRWARKGHLPIPRQIFKRQRPDGPDKHSAEFLANSAPLPTSARSQQPPSSEASAFKRRMADVRRRNLTEGIQELWTRKVQTDKERHDHRFAKLRHNHDAMVAPRRPDELFTDSSIPASVLQTEVPRDPARFERALESAARTRSIGELKAQDRKDALQHMYMAARGFIVDEKDLEKEVDRLFRDDFFSESTTGSGRKSMNAWDLYDKPTTVRQMMGDTLRTDNRALIAGQDESDRTVKRQLRVAEELTGGPIDEV